MKVDDVKVEIFVAGDGKNYPKQGDVVTIHYTAFLLLNKSGTKPEQQRDYKRLKFDSTRERGMKKPFQFQLYSEQVIAGLEDGVSQLSVGEKALITIPAHRAYGSKGFPGLVPKNCDVLFEVELIEFE